MARKPRGRAIDGWLVLDKPAGMTSTQALAKVKRIFGAKKAGHAGTLDPLATGCLPIAFGEATKTVPFAMDGRKVYRFTVSWGAETDTDDSEGRTVAASEIRPTPDDICAAVPAFRGTILQVPPRYSAIKVQGERAYDLARDGEEALNILAGTHPHGGFRLVLLDLKIPKLDGFEVLRRIRADTVTRSLPVVVFSSSDVVEDIERTYKFGANSYVCKPVDFETHSNVVKQIGRFWLGLNRIP